MTSTLAQKGTLWKYQRALRNILERFRRPGWPARILVALLAALPVYADDPWENAVGVLQTAFTGTMIASYRGESVSISDVATVLLESDKDDRLLFDVEVAEL